MKREIEVVYKGAIYPNIKNLFKSLGREKDYNRFIIWKNRHYLDNSWSINEFIERFLENRIEEKIEYHGKMYPSLDTILKSIDSSLNASAFANWRKINKELKFSTLDEAIDYYVYNVKHSGRKGNKINVDNKKYESIVKFFRINTISYSSGCFRAWCNRNNKELNKDNAGALISEYMKVYKPNGHRLANH